ncbi:putative outer membrane starch-binding protein [Dysgonomonas alginatilytica]|uniref:Putative outer membrane starch-binding protein n=1 Tax=Dysgonomonas alginatilytica TaxID=1605892 RepID=A0A2V3PXS8_9BACT|nr:RagB/SusD family nutrient uptake outer membrane protein [Dysgonomonas alginatilytica]PXV65907.1 putative outer membrane starch-binding protein [Dysgonomonas alginatilytica]
MNKYKIFITACIALVAFSGCYDLDRFPYDQVSEGTFWKNETQVNQGMMGVYAALRVDDAFGLKFAIDNISDMGVGYDPQGYGPVLLGTYTGRTDLIKKSWKSLYDGVMRSNLAIRKIADATELTPEAKSKYVAEAKFLRAVFYFQLYNLYGGVPLYDETINQSTDYNTLLKARNTDKETVDFIIKDLTDIINGGSLPVKWETANTGRATLGAAYALRGKVYLYTKEYQKASQDFEEVITDSKGKGYGYKLYNNYADLFKPEGDESSEMIFAIQNAGGVGTDYGMPMTFYMGTRSSFGSCWNNVMPSVKLVNEYELKDGKKFDWEDYIPGFTDVTNVGQIIRDETFVSTLKSDGKAVDTYPKNKDILLSMYENRDPRMASTVLLPYTMYNGWVSNKARTCEFVVARNVAPNESNGFVRINGAYTESYVFRKFVAEGNMNGGINNRAHTPINFPLIRLADVYLMYAECQNELDKQGIAVEYINKVRQRPSVNMPAVNSGPAWLKASTKEEVFDRIQHERAIELAAEGHRWDDLRRWKLAKTLIPGNVYGFTGKRLLTKVFIDRDMLWPIPGEEMDINPNLVNNPGWQ